jgi:hypothetical protein
MLGSKRRDKWVAGCCETHYSLQINVEKVKKMFLSCQFHMKNTGKKHEVRAFFSFPPREIEAKHWFATAKADQRSEWLRVRWEINEWLDAVKHTI